MTPLNYCRFPVALNGFGISSAYEIQILSWAAMLSDGLKQSNNQLAEILHTDRRTVINSINRLKNKALIENIGTKYNRILKASGEIVALLNGDDVSLSGGEKVSQNGEKVSQNSEKTDTHKRRKKKEARRQISFNPTGGEFSGITQADFERWAKAYPGINLQSEIAKAGDWLIRKNETRADYLKFLANWFSRCTPAPEPTLPEPDSDAIFEKLEFPQETIAGFKREGLTA